MAIGRPRLLVLRGLGLGDLLTVVPALRALRRAHPEHRIVLAAPGYLADLLPMIGAVDELLDVSGPGPLPLTAPSFAGPALASPTATSRNIEASGIEAPGIESPDIAVNLHGRGPQSTLALSATRPGRLLTHALPDGVSGPPWCQAVHEVRRWCALLEWYGIAADPQDLRLKADLRPKAPASADQTDQSDQPGQTGECGQVVIHPGAAYPARRWPPERFAQVARVLRGRGLPVLVTGRERRLVRHVAVLAGLPAGGTPLTGVGELARVVAGARLVICGDTGVAHLATGLGTPSVVLFGPVSPALWGPPPGKRHVALWSGRSGDPHGGVPDPGLLEISVSEVVEVATRLLEGRTR